MAMEDKGIRKEFTFVDNDKYLSVNVQFVEDNSFSVILKATGLPSNEAVGLFDYIVRPYFFSFNSRLNIFNEGHSK